MCRPPNPSCMGETRRIDVGRDAEGSGVSLPVEEVLTGRSFLTGKSGAGKSVLEGTPVYTETGRKPIEDVERGERVLSLNRRSYEQEFREVRATIEHESGELLRITLEDGTELVGTEDHSFLTVDDLEIVPIEGRNITEGTWIPLSRELPAVESVSEIDLAKYVTESPDLDIEADRIRSAQKWDDRYLDLTFDTGRVIGLYLAEGSFDSHLTIQISNLDDEVRSFLDGRDFNVYDRTCNRGYKPFAKFLEDEFGRGSTGKRIPNWVFNAPAEFNAGLLSGHIDGDGTIGNSNLTIMSASDELLDGIQELFRQFGVSSAIEEKLVMYENEERRYGRLRVDAFSTARANEVVDLLVEEKAGRLTKLASRIEDGGSYNSKDMIPNFGDVLNTAARERDWTKRESQNRVGGASIHAATRKGKLGRKTYNEYVERLGVEGKARAFGRSDVQWKRVVSVERMDETRRVYDLDVKLNDNFVADGVFVHNSNSVSVVIEKLLDAGYPVLIVDTDGEYYGLKEEYELLHAGADEECDIQVSPEHAEKVADLALGENVPVILDVSGYLDGSEASDLIRETARHLFAKEKKLKKPFLLVIEEVHEYIPEGGGLDDTGRMLIKVGKRGRKHGLGIVGISQRPADVKKDFITQANWLVWHRLTWQNDTDVVKRVVGSEYAGEVADLDDGEAFLQRDWTDGGVTRVQFDRKQTFDAGATPGLEEFERPELKSVSDGLVNDLAEITDAKQREQDRIEELEAKLESKTDRIEELQGELRAARDVSQAAKRMADALTGDTEEQPFGYESRLEDKEERIEELEAELDAKRRTIRDLRERRAGDAGGVPEDAGSVPDVSEATASSEATNGQSEPATGERSGSDGVGFAGLGGATTDVSPEESARSGVVVGETAEESPGDDGEGRGVDDDLIDEHMDRLRRKGERLQADTAAMPPEADLEIDEMLDLAHSEPVVAAIDAAHQDSLCNHEHAWSIVAALAAQAPMRLDGLAECIPLDTEAVGSFLAELDTRSLVARDSERRYRLNVAEMRCLTDSVESEEQST
ncbi:MAG: LAGLIDADG family homing endonuclease [Halobacteriales archaeon]